MVPSSPSGHSHSDEVELLPHDFSELINVEPHLRTDGNRVGDLIRQSYLAAYPHLVKKIELFDTDSVNLVEHKDGRYVYTVSLVESQAALLDSPVTLDDVDQILKSRIRLVDRNIAARKLVLKQDGPDLVGVNVGERNSVGD